MLINFMFSYFHTCSTKLHVGSTELNMSEQMSFSKWNEWMVRCEFVEVSRLRGKV